MDERFDKGKKRDTNQEEKALFYYLENIDKLIVPFVSLDEAGDNLNLSSNIVNVLGWDDDTMLAELRLNNENAFIFSGMIKEVNKALKTGRISNKAPWFKKLEEKMLRFALYTASTSQEMNIKQGEKDLEKHADEILQKIRKKHLPEEGNSDKK